MSGEPNAPIVERIKRWFDSACDPPLETVLADEIHWPTALLCAGTVLTLLGTCELIAHVLG